jgi:hypothetical protein
MKERSKEITLPAALNITMSQDRSGAHTYHLSIEDVTSRCIIVELTISPEQFALALARLAVRPCEATWRVDGLGKKYEHKTEAVPYKRDFDLKGKELGVGVDAT